LGQFEQVLDAKGRAPGRNGDVGIAWENTGPLSRKRDETTGVVVEVNSVLAPIVTIRHQGELTPPERVEGMSDLESLAGTAQIGCT
jgi:hypothetical protein